MLHLTHSGFYAGKTICGAPKNDTDVYQHYSLTYKLPESANLCPKCKAIFEEEEARAEYEEQTGQCYDCHRPAKVTLETYPRPTFCVTVTEHPLKRRDDNAHGTASRFYYDHLTPAVKAFCEYCSGADTGCVQLWDRDEEMGRLYI
jgi:hypothetical protein